MNRFDRRARLLATCLAALAGYVDALGFLQLGGFFVSFMSGNSTRLGVGLAQGAPSAVTAAALIGTFVVGVVMGSMTGHAAGLRRRPVVMGLVALLLASAAASHMFGAPQLAIVAMGLAMGAENAVFEENGDVRIGLTYMTGTLVKLGQRLAGALVGREPWAWTPYFLLWAGLVAGGVAGGFSYARLGPGSLWIAAAAAIILAMAATIVGPDKPAHLDRYDD